MEMVKASLKIRTFGDPCLRKKSDLVEEVGPSERMLIEAMLETMYEHKGVGLAAPQVGINQQIFVADAGDGPMVVVNPKIIKRSGLGKADEGCLSIPGVTVKVNRPQKIVVQYVDQNNQRQEQELIDLKARVFQHEKDHLQGKLIIDYLSLPKKLKIQKQLKQISKSAFSTTPSKKSPEK